MGRMYAILDPSGYAYCSEPGIDFTFTGKGILDAFASQQAGKLFPGDCFSPPGSEYILPKPRQWDTEWYKSASFHLANLDYTRWTWAAGVSPREWVQTARPGDNLYPDNKWFSIAQVPAGVVSLDSRNYTNLGIAAGITFPAGMATIGAAGYTPAGDPISGYDYHPFLQFAMAPPPNEVVVFGWQNLALVLTRQVVYLLRNRAGDGVTWEQMGSWHNSAFGRDVYAVGQRLPVTPQFQQPALRLTERLVTALPVGLQELFLFFDRGNYGVVNLAADVTTDRAPAAGYFWIAAAPGQRVIAQIQCVCYAPAALTFLGGAGAGAGPYLFDLGGGFGTYRPTATPQFNVTDYVMYHSPSGTSDITTTRTSNSFETLSSYSHQRIDVALLDEVGGGWISDGTHSRGGLSVGLFPGNPGSNFGYLTPQLRTVELKFPTLLQARSSTNLVLDDHKWKGWKFEASYYEPLGKRISLDLWDRGAQDIANAGLDERDGYPIHISEDTNADGVPDTVRAAGWIVEPTLEVFKPEGGSVAQPIQFYRLSGKGVLTQADSQWVFLPKVLNPAGNGFVEHTFAVAESLLQSGIDVADGTRFFVAPDPWSGTYIAQLPDTPGQQKGTAGTQREDTWGPRWHEKRLAYIKRICDHWSAWVVYERLDGKISYHPDLPIQAFTGARYYRQATIYRSHAEATAAGAGGQCMLENPQRSLVSIEANAILVTGKDEENGLVPHMLDIDTRSLTDHTYENYEGTLKAKRFTPILAGSQRAMTLACRVPLLKLSRRKRNWTVPVPLAPWQMSGPMDVGYVFQMLGNRAGDYLCVHMSVEQLSGDGGSGRGNIIHTELTGEKLSAAAVRGLALGTYPGAAA